MQNRTRTCLILTSHVEGENQIPSDFDRYDSVICADGGLDFARRHGIRPDYLIGDYDSTKKPSASESPAGAELILLPREKDMTDSEAALDLAWSVGYRDITVLGGLGGRFDHTMGNIGMLCKYLGRMDRLVLEDGYNRVFLLAPGHYVLPKTRFHYLGLTAYGGPVSGITLRGVKYPLNRAALSIATTLGVSNEIIGEEANLSFADGKLLIILSNDVPHESMCENN